GASTVFATPVIAVSNCTAAETAAPPIPRIGRVSPAARAVPTFVIREPAAFRACWALFRRPSHSVRSAPMVTMTSASAMYLPPPLRAPPLAPDLTSLFGDQDDVLEILPVVQPVLQFADGHASEVAGDAVENSPL